MVVAWKMGENPEGVLRVHILALESAIDGKIPTHHAAMTWLVPHAADCITKYLVGGDGKTPYHKLFAKPFREDIFECGEQIFIRKHKAALKYLDPHWMPGTWLWRRWGHFTHLIWHGETIFEAYAVQRVPQDQRWSKTSWKTSLPLRGIGPLLMLGLKSRLK